MAVDENEYLAAIRELTDTVGSLCADIWIDEIIEHAEALTAQLAQAEANAERWKRTARLKHNEHRVGPEHPAAGRG